MSTTFEIGRWPAAVRRCLSQRGDGPTFTSSNTRAVKRRQISGSISTAAWSSTASPPAGSASLAPGSGRSSAPVSACTSRATPYTARQSGRLGLTSRSSTSSSITSASGSCVPGASSPGSTIVSAWSPLIPTSSSARIIPLDLTPRSFASPSSVPSGMIAPGRATATVWPAATLGAPHTIWRSVPEPSSTMQTVSRSASGCRSADRTLPTTNAEVSPTPTCSILSGWRPAEASRSPSSSAERAGSQ